MRQNEGVCVHLNICVVPFKSLVSRQYFGVVVFLKEITTFFSARLH